MGYGYHGKILRVNLTNGTTSVEELDDKFCRRYLGGAGFDSYYLMKELKKGIDPLGPENKLIFMGGPLTGLPLSGSSRNAVAAKSPLTGGIAKSEVGGYFGTEFRRSGFDGMIVEGKSPKPVYIWLTDNKAEIRDATHLWGKETLETETAIREELGDKRLRFAAIGPAGENMVRFSCVMNDLKDAAGRGGMGAVMGSKNLKAIAARGSIQPELANPDGLQKYRKWLIDNPQAYAMLAQYGTGAPAMMQGMIPAGNLPIRNFRDGDFPVANIDGGTLKETIGVGMEGCYGCVVRCKKLVKVDDPGLEVDPIYGGPEYETLASMGSCCGVDDLKVISKANQICNANALDTISAGVAVSFAMECFENGLLTNKDTNGIDLHFGNGQALLQVLELIARREGIGDLLAEGCLKAAQKIGQGAEKFAMNVKGLEVPMHDPRAKAALGVGYAINPHGADHCANLHDPMFSMDPGPIAMMHPLGHIDPLPSGDLGPKKIALFTDFHHYRAIADCGVICMFVPYSPAALTELVQITTGWDTGIGELLKIGHRTMTLHRMFNVREGFTAADDKLPHRYFEKHVGGPSADNPPYKEDEHAAAVKYYYSLMGWDANGVPTPETLQMLDLDWAASA